MVFFLISSMVLGILDQLLIFSQLHLIELLGLLELSHLIYPRLLTGLLHKPKSYGISSQIFGLILFLVIDDFEWFWMESLRKHIQLMWESSRFYFWPYTFPTIH